MIPTRFAVGMGFSMPFLLTLAHTDEPDRAAILLPPGQEVIDTAVLLDTDNLPAPVERFDTGPPAEVPLPAAVAP